MRIVGGKAKGTILLSPAGKNTTRPTLGRVRESIFNVLANVGLEEAKVLDIFAGTGAMGLEALSRGAAEAVFIDRTTSDIIRKNAERCHMSGQVKVIVRDVTPALKLLGGKSFDYIFMDPPYRKGYINEILKEILSSAKFMAEAGVVDFVGDEETIANGVRQLVSMLPSNNAEGTVCTDNQDDLNRVCQDMEAEIADPALALTDISDDGVFVEAKAEYAKEMVTGFILVDGVTVGAVANRTALYDENGEKAEEFAPVLTTAGAYKAAEFVTFCNAFEIPVLTLTNVKGFEATVKSERTIAKAAAKLVYAFSNADVPKVNIITGEAYGSAYVAMNSKSIGADMVYAWPQASIGMMDASLAAKIMYADDIVNPEDTRKRVIAAFDMLFTKREDRPAKKHGTV